MKRRTRKQVLADPVSAHEAPDRAALLSDVFSRHVAEHSFVQAHPKLRPVAEKLAEQLGGFYQLVGEVVFDEKTE